MQIFIATFVLFALAVLAMAIGAIFSKRTLQGSCGGVGADDCVCSAAEQAACPRRAASEEA